MKRSEIRPLTPEQARQFLQVAKGDRLEALYSVAIALGLRQGEALGLRWEDVDMQQGWVQARMALQRVDGKLQLVEPKTEKSRRAIKIPAVVRDALREHRVRQLRERLLAGQAWQEHGLVFTTTIGTPLDARNVVRQFHRLRTRAGLSWLRFHDLRHAYGPLLAAQGSIPGGDGADGPFAAECHHAGLYSCCPGAGARGGGQDRRCARSTLNMLPPSPGCSATRTPASPCVSTRTSHYRGGGGSSGRARCCLRAARS
ncbi:hypothetical protein NITHO_3980004 [Nitrolancea hollandica Lb]|uniref:Tyr recombinase domain-containing protein n=1 Tax=Nitrolancea hollandica Lb TaxID=1129897 RepID=I4EJE3_9BACT|nr:hypothetical protein NITHO_3980004 [Nitrolancea hollandica Lb]